MNTLDRQRRAARRNTRRAFTLMEVIVAVTIVALLAALVVPRLWTYVGEAKQKKALADASSLAQAVTLYMTEEGVSTLPDDFSLEMLVADSDPILGNKKALIDPWDNPFIIRIPGEVNYDFDVISFGADGKIGGEGDDQDIIHGQEIVD